MQSFCGSHEFHFQYNCSITGTYIRFIRKKCVAINPRATLQQSEKSTIKLNISYFAYLTCVAPVPMGFENCIFSELTIFIRDSSKLILTHLTGGNFITLWSTLDIDHKLSKLYRGGHWGVLYSTENDPQPQLIPRPQMIPKMDRK